MYLGKNVPQIWRIHLLNLKQKNPPRPYNKPSLPLLFSHSVESESLRPHGLQHARPPCTPPTRGACSNLRPSSRWCHPTISSSVVPFSSWLQPFPATRSFLMSQFFESGGQSIRASASASVLPMNAQGWFPLGLTGLLKWNSFFPQRWNISKMHWWWEAKRESFEFFLLNLTSTSLKWFCSWVTLWIQSCLQTAKGTVSVSIGRILLHIWNNYVGTTTSSKHASAAQILII